MRSSLKIGLAGGLTVAAAVALAGWYVVPAGATSVRDVHYAERGDAGIIYDAHSSMRQFHYLRSLLNVSYKVAARNVRVPGLACPDVTIVRVYTIYGLPWGRYWLGCVESGYLR